MKNLDVCKSIVVICITVALLGGCAGQKKNEQKLEEKQAEKLIPTEYKILDLKMGMPKKELLQNGFDCSPLEFSGYCETYTYPDGGNPHYKSINKNGTINGIQAYLDHKNEVYKISLHSRHTPVQTDIEQFKTTLSQLLENNPNLDQKVEVLKSAFLNNALFASLTIVDKARANLFDSQKKQKSGNDAADIKNFNKK